MPNFNLQRQVHSLYQMQRRERSLRHLADGLMLALRITPYETGLIPWLGTPECRSNREAIRHWVRLQLPAAQPEQADTEALQRRLRFKLMQIQDGDGA